MEKVPTSLEMYSIGRPIIEEKKPAIFYFSLTAKHSLQIDPYNQFAKALENLDCRIYSASLPHHDQAFEKIFAYDESFSNEMPIFEDPMKKWLEDPKTYSLEFDKYLHSIQASIHELIDLNLLDTNKIAIAGLSRGGLIAYHLLARMPEIKIALGFAPVVDLEYIVKKQDPNLHQWNCSDLISSFPNKIIRTYIGNTDKRVSTDLNKDFIDKASLVCDAKIILRDSIGHEGHGTSKEAFLEGATFIKNAFDL